MTMLFTIVFTYFASFTGYEDGILEVFSNLQVQEYKFGGKIDKFGGKSFKNFNSAEFMEFVFSKSAFDSMSQDLTTTKKHGISHITHHTLHSTYCI